nr:DCC1-like thiol-disulfide oxidoreductase family protein [Streptomyces sp. SID8379]
MYDAECSLCTFVRNWLVKQRQLVPLDLVPAGHSRARALFPDLDHSATLSEITVIADGGQIYRGQAAWVVCMWALREYRPTAHRMATPAGMKIAKQVVLGAAKYREAQWGARAGGGAYRRADGWTYDPKHGWFHEAYGYGGAASRGGAPARDAACDGGCRAAD